MQQLVDRFLRYVKIDTQSQEDVQDQYPSTVKQKDLSRLLVKELQELGLTDAVMDEYGIVMATYPSNLTDEENQVPVIGFLAHMDTSPEVSGKDVKPVIHKNYDGGDIHYSADASLILSPDNNPELRKYIGTDIITSDGSTLLGADNKAGIAEIMTLIQTLNDNPEIKHGTLRIAFTPDEEIGAGTVHFNVEKFGADFAYTVDGEKVGDVENETFNAAVALFKIHGINLHPGYAKDKMVNAIRIVSDIVQRLNGEPSPETTENREGYLHPYIIEGGVETVQLKVLIRDFDREGMDRKERRLQEIQRITGEKYPQATIDLEVKQQYENMRLKLDESPQVVAYALEAVRRAGIEPQLHIIRGGTDGARLCYMGLLTPNLFTGGMNFHGKTEWIPVQGMVKSVEALIELVKVWVEKSLND